MSQRINIYCDTNVYIDILKDDRINSGASFRAMRLMSSNGIRPYISTQSIVDAAYIMSHTYKYDISRFKDSVRMINGNFNIVSITAEDIIAASGSPIEDFEDAAQVSCAGRHGCRAILSADANLKKCSPIPVFTPEEFIAKLTGGN